MSELYSLYDLLDGTFAKGIRVPSIQRAYVQGRDDKSGERARRNFMPELVRVSRQDPNREARWKNLHFIYGIKDATGFFLPLDGQQRLTTLFLLAWYSGTIDSGWIFEYETRRAASYFIRGLLNTRCQIGEDGVKAFLNRQVWYIPAWEEDPTVKGMIEMLIAIHEAVGGDCALDLTRIRFSVRELSVTEKSYGQIFLKMNARGKPLTDWENLKAILDEHIPKDIGFNWKDLVDGDWACKIWENLKSQDDTSRVDKLNHIFEKVVRMAYVMCHEVNYDAIPKYDVEPYLIDSWLKVGQREFYLLLYDLFQGLAHSWREIAVRWTKDRCRNRAWCVKESECEGNAFDKWLLENGHEYENVIRLFFIIKSFSRSGGSERKLRVALNLLDATSFNGRAIDVFRTFKLVLDCGVKFLKDDAGLDWGIKSVSYRRQLADEVSKQGFDEKKIIQIEKDPLVHLGSTRFVAWGAFVDAEDIQKRVVWVRCQIENDWVGFFKKLVARLELGAHGELSESLAIPYDNLRRWGVCLMHKDIIIDALKKLVDAPNAKVCYPAWLAHFEAIARVGRLGNNYGLRTYDGWTYAIAETQRSRHSIRLDYNENEAQNRKLLKGEVIYYNEGEDRVAPREAKVKGVGYDVWDRSWYEGTAPIPVPVR